LTLGGPPFKWVPAKSKFPVSQIHQQFTALYRNLPYDKGITTMSTCKKQLNGYRPTLSNLSPIFTTEFVGEKLKYCKTNPISSAHFYRETPKIKMLNVTKRTQFPPFSAQL